MSSSVTSSGLKRVASVNEILAKLRLERRDLNNLSTSQLETIFLDLTVKEISLLCRINRKFNTVCKDESFWRIKVLNDYGVGKKYGDTIASQSSAAGATWRQTAITMDKNNMINLNDVWINGRTYKQILDEALQQEYRLDFFEDLQEKYLLPYADNSEEDVLRLLDRYSDYDDGKLQRFANDVLGRDYTEDELNDIFYIKNREIKVIYSAVSSYETNETAGAGYLDPIFHVMYNSSTPEHRLHPIGYW